MSCLKPALEAVGHDLEPRLARSLQGMLGGMIRAYLPQRWVFVTEEGTASLTIDERGHASVADGPLVSPDVTIASSHARLSAALTTRDRTRIPPGPFTATPHTAKGRAAYEFLRGRLGL
ncbi:MAG: hypothetical protein L3J93_00875 [Thermoplasmata archaeon]|nr:hypothetical protein [Thermoplasmata archaeon]